MSSNHWIEKELKNDLMQWKQIQSLSEEERNQLMKRDSILLHAVFSQSVKCLQYGIWIIGLLFIVDSIYRVVIGTDWWIPLIHLVGSLFFAFLVYLIACLR